MQFITPPTDSLYKFIAISGIAVSALAASYPINEYYEGIENTRNLKKALLEHEIAFAELIFPKHLDLKSLDEKELQKAIEQLDKSAPDFKEKMMKMLRLNLEFNDKLKEYDGLRAHLVKVVSDVFYVILFGILTSGFGFYQWYFRIQRYSDMILKKQALAETSGS